MSSLILPRVSRRTVKLCKKTASRNTQMSGLSDIISNSWHRHLRQFVFVVSSQTASGCSRSWRCHRARLRCNSCDENNPASSYRFVCQSFLCTSCFQSPTRLGLGHKKSSQCFDRQTCKSWSKDPSCVHSNITKINHWKVIVKIVKFWLATSAA